MFVLSDGWHLYVHKYESNASMLSRGFFYLKSVNFLFLFSIVQPVIPDVCTKFQNPRSSSSREIFDENFNIHYLGEIEKGKNRKRSQK